MGASHAVNGRSMSVCIDRTWVRIREIHFDGLGLHVAGKACNPRHDCLLRCGEDGSIGVVESMEVSVLDEA